MSVLLVTGLSFAWYWHAGAWRQVQQVQEQSAQHEALQSLVAQMGGVTGMINKLQLQVKNNPNDAEGWYWLGRLYEHQQQFFAAHEALQHALQLNPSNEKIILALAETQQLLQQPQTMH